MTIHRTENEDEIRRSHKIIEYTGLTAALTSVGLAVGLASQRVLENLAAGVMLMIFRNFQIGDMIVVSGRTGIVSKITLLSTRIDTFQNVRISIPNKDMFGSIVENYSRNPMRYQISLRFVSRSLACSRASMRALSRAPSFTRCLCRSRARVLSESGNAHTALRCAGAQTSRCKQLRPPTCDSCATLLKGSRRNMLILQRNIWPRANGNELALSRPTHHEPVGRAATHCSTLQRTATLCNALQRTATHCNTLRHTATQGSVASNSSRPGGARLCECACVCVHVCASCVCAGITYIFDMFV